SAIADAQVVFVAVGTPPRADGGADLRAVDKVAEMVAEHAPLVVDTRNALGGFPGRENIWKA
ncbi:MAG: hypothetical protein QGH11_01885, partial [Pirellulaceae bacterium]|nr:hypothetical protein [Pirellulaceae bacterium]